MASFITFSKKFLKGIFFTIPVSIVIVDCLGFVAKVEGGSMQPILNPDSDDSKNDFIFLNKWKLRHYEVKRGDIVCLFSPKDPEVKLVKRIIGLEGDFLRTLGYHDEIVEIPPGHCWVEGDHRGYSLDSNTFGPIPLGLVEAKATHIIWPIHRWQSIDSFVPDDRKPVNLSFSNIFSCNL